MGAKILTLIALMNHSFDRMLHMAYTVLIMVIIIPMFCASSAAAAAAAAAAACQNVTHHFTVIGKDPRLTYFGNVELGRDVSLDDLRKRYHAVRHDTVCMAQQAAPAPACMWFTCG